MLEIVNKGKSFKKDMDKCNVQGGKTCTKLWQATKEEVEIVQDAKWDGWWIWWNNNNGSKPVLKPTYNKLFTEVLCVLPLSAEKC